MQKDWARKIRLYYILWTRLIWQKKGLWLRAILCWTIGMVFLLADVEHQYDVRFETRGRQKSDKDIVLVVLDSEEASVLQVQGFDDFGLFSEAAVRTEYYYWNSLPWTEVLNTILREQPAVIGVSPFLGENIDTRKLSNPDLQPFFNNKIIWSTQRDTDGRALSSKFAKAFSRNAGLNEISPDRDGVVRRWSSTSERYPHFAIQILRKYSSQKNQNTTESTQSEVINYRGPSGTFTSIPVQDILNKKYQKDFFKNKIVLVGLQKKDAVQYRTPLGEMSRIEITANILDNLLNDRMIKRLNMNWLAILILAFVLVVALITSRYPQFLAFFVIAILNIFYVAFSLWIFDTQYYWTPILAPLIVTFVTYLIYLSFQLTLKDYLNTQLEREHKLLSDLEELKNNFLSLISHDLKTPIAKIQAICDRLIAQYPQNEFTADINSLRDVSTELYRYIRTILQITRVESRDFRLSKDATDINEIIEAVVAQLEPLARNKKITFQVNLEPMFLVEIDHVLIHEVILNLVENAIKYTPDAGLVTISSQEVDEQVIVMVEDNGPGIPEVEKQRIFEKFYRGESGKSQPKGSGLGLYLVKYFVELHGGKVFLDSSPKRGTKVGFSLPLNEVLPEAILPQEDRVLHEERNV